MDNVRIRCKEINSINPIEFYSDFSLITLKQTNPVFTAAQTNIDVQDIINKAIESENIIIQNLGNKINVELFLSNKNTKIIFPLYHNKINITNQYNIYYEPPTQLPVKQIFYPPEYIKRPTIYQTYNIPNTQNYFPNEQFQNVLTNNDNNILELSAYNHLKGENEQMNEKIKNLYSDIEELQNKMNILLKNKENTNLYNEKQNYIYENNQLKQQMKMLYKEIENLKLQNNNINNNINQNEDELSSYKSKIDELEKENNDLKTQNQNLLNDRNLQQILENDKNKDLKIIKADIIENNKEFEFVIRKICNYNNENQNLKIDLIYKASVDSDKAKIFHEKCDNAKSTIVLVRSGNRKRFGGFTFKNWKGNSFKKDDKAFVFSIDKKKIYDIIPGEDAIGCFPGFGPIFAGCVIKINDDAFSNGGSTFLKGQNYDTKEDYEINGGVKDFEIEDIEVFSVKFE